MRKPIQWMPLRSAARRSNGPARCLGWYVWNNTGDKAYLRTAAGTGMDYCVWTPGGAGYKIC